MRPSRWSSIRCRPSGGLAVLAALFAATRLSAQTPPADAPIQDNSFLVEEAYNQEHGVVQTIFTYQHTSGTTGYVGTVTQEWPVPGQKHQLSLTVPLQEIPAGTGVARGLGDLAVNYRFQAIGDGNAPVAFSPRVTLLVPSGDSDRALGSGGLGLQVMLPVSAALSPAFVSHTNLGATHAFSARSADGSRASLTSWNAGQSFVWLAHRNFNVLLEAVVARNQTVAEGGQRATATEVWVSPGVRFALNLPGHFQVVPGVGVPIGVGPSSGKTGLFLYLSLELPLFGGGKE